jgi:tetratricopeptide (TPR) repeat protein
MLSSRNHCTYAAVFGLGGVGKTEVALEFAYRRREKSPGCSIFWVSAINSIAFLQGYLEMGEKLQIPNIGKIASSPVKLIEAVKKKLSGESSGQWLLIIDHVEIFDIRNEEANESITGSLPLLDCLPKSPQGSVIFTSRNRRAAYDLAGNNIVEVAAMDPGQAKDLLRNWASPEFLGKDEAVISKLLELLTRLPLAIIQAGAYMTREEQTTLDYLETYEKDALRLLREEVTDAGISTSTRDPVSITFRISFEQIQRKDKLAVEYLSSMACLFPQNIPKSLLPTCLSTTEEKRAISTLKAYSFITERDRDHYDMQPLVHLLTQDWLKNPKHSDPPIKLQSSVHSVIARWWTKASAYVPFTSRLTLDALDETKTLKSWTEQTILRIAESFPDKDLDDRASWTEYLPHAMHALFLPHSSKGNEDIEIELLRKVRYCLEMNGQWKQAEKVAERRMNLKIDFLGEDDPSTLTSMSDWAFLLGTVGKYALAERTHRRAIKLRKNVPGLEDRATLKSMSLLALTLSQKGDMKEAKELNEQILARRVVLLGPDDPDTLQTKSRLAAVLSSQGNYEEAEAMHRQVLELRAKTMGPKHRDTLSSKVYLAVVLKNQKKYQKAEDIYREILKLDLEKGPEHSDTLSTMSLLGTLLHCQGRDKEAEDMLKQTLHLREKVLGPDDHQTLLTMNSLASVLTSLDRFDEAEKMQKQALKELEKLLAKPNHPNILSGMANLACIYLKKGMFKKAGDLAREIIGKAEDDTGDTHPDMIAGLNNLLSIYIDQGRLEDSERLGIKLLEIARRELGEENCHTLDVKSQLSSHQKQAALKELGNMQTTEMNTKKKRLKRGRNDDDTDDSERARRKQKI